MGGYWFGSVVVLVRASKDSWSRDCEFGSRPVHCRVAWSTQPSISPGIGKSSSTLLTNNKLWCERCESTTNPAPVLRIAASRGLSKLTQNVIRSSHGHSAPSLKISCKSVQSFSRNLADKETKKETKMQTNKQTNRSITIPVPDTIGGGVTKRRPHCVRRRHKYGSCMGVQDMCSSQ